MWYMISFVSLAKNLDTDLNWGLSEKEAALRLRSHGRNKLAEKKKPSLALRFFAQLNDFMILILLGAAAVSFLAGFFRGESDFIDPIIILMIVVLNAILGLVQESRAEKALEALKKMSAPWVRVFRDGRLEEVAAETLVPGDKILLEAGDMIPADARLIESHSLKVEESALTGESLPVEKDADIVLSSQQTLGDRRNLVYFGSSVVYGRAVAIVTETGMNTEVGKIAHMIMSDKQDATNLQKRLDRTGQILGIGAMGICVIIFFMGLIRHYPPFDMFMTAVSLAVAAIPEGLPAIVTIMLAIGVMRMARRNAVIRKLPAVETLGSATVICTDKTGTLTQNKMKVVEVADCNGSLEARSDTRKTILEYGTLCNDTYTGEKDLIGDPTEKAFVYAAESLGMRKLDLDLAKPRMGEIPFDSKRKLMSTVHKEGNGFLMITKGAPEVLIERCNSCLDNGRVKPLSSGYRRQIVESNNAMADKALRVIAVSYKLMESLPAHIDTDQEDGLVFLGLVGLVDPPREEVYDAVKTCRGAGIETVMITGDHVKTALALAQKVGITGKSGKAMTGEELNQLSQDELCQRIDDYRVFARVSPEHKVRIVKAFQSRGEIVAMTGDGVNDAPALKSADIGCAMGINGTEVAKGASDMVLTDDNFATIVEAVREGRGIYDNIKKSVHFLLSSNIGEIITIFVAMLLGWGAPLFAIHLLWVNLITDSLPAIALGLDPVDSDAMRRKPCTHNNLFADGLWQRIGLEGLMIGFLSLTAFGIGNYYFNEEVARTMVFATLSISQLVHAFNMRSEKSVFALNLLDNIYLIGAFAVGLALQVAVITIQPMSASFKVVELNNIQWIIVGALSIVPLVVVEIQKFVTRSAAAVLQGRAARLQRAA